MKINTTVLIIVILLAIVVGISQTDLIPETVVAEEVKDINRVIIGEYTIIYKASLYTYVKEHWFEGDRCYYIKDDGKKGSLPSIDVRTEEGYLPKDQLHNYGYFEYPIEDIIFGE